MRHLRLRTITKHLTTFGVKAGRSGLHHPLHLYIIGFTHERVARARRPPALPALEPARARLAPPPHARRGRAEELGLGAPLLPGELRAAPVARPGDPARRRRGDAAQGGPGREHGAGDPAAPVQRYARPRLPRPRRALPGPPPRARAPGGAARARPARRRGRPARARGRAPARDRLL